MSIAKTVKGREALAQRGVLSRRERQLLILCDARRTAADLARMMGTDIVQDIERLGVHGLLVVVSPTLRRVAEFSDTGTIEFNLADAEAQDVTAA